MKTYSERRAAVYFTASRAMRKIAVDVLDDCVERAEFLGESVHWVKNQAAVNARLSVELEGQGHEQTVATPRQNTDLYQSRREYELAIDRFEERARSFGVDPRTIRS